ncbi:MAG: hypothetical protein U5K75_04225 [Ahrensia sp.]|nr:hypothetical protein [Ahrensia sp.]
MSKEKIGLSIFAGLLGLTGLVSSGALIDVNPILERFKGGATEQQQPQQVSTTVPSEKSEMTEHRASSSPQ